MNNALLDIVACPQCHGRLTYDKASQRFICQFEQLAYPIVEGIPVLLPEQAILLTETQEDN